MQGCKRIEYGSDNDKIIFVCVFVFFNTNIDHLSDTNMDWILNEYEYESNINEYEYMYGYNLNI